MRKILALIAFIPTLAFPAAATWTNPSGTTAVAVCAQAGVTCDAPTLATQGLSLDNVQGFSVTACATASDKTLSGAGTLLAYVYDDAVGAWSRVPDLDLTNATTARCVTWAGIWAAAPRGRVAYVPSTLTASANSVTVYMIGEKRK